MELLSGPFRIRYFSNLTKVTICFYVIRIPGTVICIAYNIFVLINSYLSLSIAVEVFSGLIKQLTNKWLMIYHPYIFLKEIGTTNYLHKGCVPYKTVLYRCRFFLSYSFYVKRVQIQAKNIRFISSFGRVVFIMLSSSFHTTFSIRQVARR